MAIETMRNAYARDEVRELIWAREKARRDYESGLATAQEKGREEGRQDEREDVARRMLGLGLKLDVIQQATGLTTEVIEGLRVGE